MNRSARDPRRTWPHLLGCALVACGLIGCATPVTDTGPHPSWPAPPQAARIVHLRDVHAAEDFATPGFLDGLGELIVGRQRQPLLRPHSVVVENDRYLCVTDQDLQAVHRLDMSTGKSQLFLQAGKTHFVSPVGLAVRGDALVVSDSALKQVFLLSDKGKLLGNIEKPGGFLRPTGLAYDPTRHLLYVADTLAHEICVFDDAGTMVRTIGEPGTLAGQLNFPTHLFVTPAGELFVTDSLNFRVQVFDLQGRYKLAVGKLGDASGHLAVPKGVAVDGDGHIYVVDSYFGNVQIFDRAGDFLLHFGKTGTQPGEFQVPTGLTIDGQNRIYVCDSYNQRVQIFQYLGGDSDDVDQNETP